ncbi:MAG: hypothetical protein J2P46_10805 [Zavarzinella sp.]|nr:hypothetical protein [Zavarzinella sp.]
MTFRMVESVLQPDGRLTLPASELPVRPVRVMVTVLEPDEDAGLTELGDYSAALTDYEERLARGEIQWQ